MCSCPRQCFFLLVQPQDKIEQIIKSSLRSVRTIQLAGCIQILERVSMCRETKTKVITLANYKEHRQYYHLHSTVKRERFIAQVYFSNETVSQKTVSTVPIGRSEIQQGIGASFKF